MQPQYQPHNDDPTLARICAGDDPADFYPGLGKQCDHPKYLAWQGPHIARREAREKAEWDALFAELGPEAPQVLEATTIDGTPSSTSGTCSAAADSMAAEVQLDVLDDAIPVRLMASEIDKPTAAIAAPTTTFTAPPPAVAALVCGRDSESHATATEFAARTAEVEDVAVAVAKPGYVFPIVSCAIKGVQELRTELEALTREFKNSDNYAAVRDRYCAISLALNEQGLWAPRFRKQPLVNPIQCKSPQSAMLHRDQLIIDAHWLWCRKSASMFSGKYERLLDAALPFDFVLAAEYAQENWASQFRAEEQLMLADDIQWQLLTTRSKKHIEVHRVLLDGVRTGTTRTAPRVKAIQRAIAGWARASPKIRGEEQAYANLWLAREMLSPKAAAKFIAELAGLMSGRAPLEASTVRQKLKGLDQRLLRA